MIGRNNFMGWQAWKIPGFLHPTTSKALRQRCDETGNLVDFGMKSRLDFGRTGKVPGLLSNF